MLKYYALGVLSMGAVFTIAFMVLLANVNVPVTKPIIETSRFQPFKLLAVGDADPGAGCSGWLNVSVYYNETSDPANYYARNLTNNASSYAWTNANNTHAGSNVSHTIEVAVTFKVRLNVSDGQAAGNSTWMPTWFEGNLTCNAWSLVNASMTRYVIGSNSTYMWLQFVYQGGISWTPGQNITPIQLYLFKWT